MNGFPRALNARNDFVNNGNCVTPFVYGFCFFWQLFSTRVTLTKVTAKNFREYFISFIRLITRGKWVEDRVCIECLWLKQLNSSFNTEHSIIYFDIYEHLLRWLPYRVTKTTELWENICLTFSNFLKIDTEVSRIKQNIFQNRPKVIPFVSVHCRTIKREFCKDLRLEHQQSFL